MKRQLLFIGFVAVALSLSGQEVIAQQSSSGELSPVFSCFYECKTGQTIDPTIWQEVTTLMLANQDADETRFANILFLDANQNILGRASNLTLSPQDLDEIHVCRTLQAAGLPVPQAGLIEVYLQDGAPGGVYGWVKNLLGRFLATVDEPFDGRVTGIAKTECRLVPPEVSTPEEINQKFFASGAPDDIPLILVENTAEEDALLPDLIPREATAIVAQRICPAVVCGDTPIRVTATIQNQGSVPSPSTDLEVLLKDSVCGEFDFIDRRAVPALDPGTETEVMVEVCFTAFDGSDGEGSRLTVDPLDRVMESNEINNMTSIPPLQ